MACGGPSVHGDSHSMNHLCRSNKQKINWEGPRNIDMKTASSRMRLQIWIEDKLGRKASLRVHAWSYVKDLKDAIQGKLGVPATRQRLFFSNKELRNTRSIYDSNISDGAKLFLALNSVSVGRGGVTSMRLYGNTPCPAILKKIISIARGGLSHGLAPRLAMEGTGGTYFLRSHKRDTVAVFKPADEEQFAPNNPRNYVGTMGQIGFRKGIFSGEGYQREVAAFLLDSKERFSGVPMTTIIEMQSNAFHYCGKGMGKAAADSIKIGSLQEYIPYDDVAGDLAPQMFPVSEVHKIAILDIRMANTDRNEANILVQRSQRFSYCNGEDINLIPIDHAYSLPDTIEIAWTDWVWLEWPQAKVPFDERGKAYIRDLDIDADIEHLRTNLGIRETCLRTMRITGMLLKKGAAAGLTLHQIATIICRNDLDAPSELEIMCSQASKLVKSAQEQIKYRSPSLNPKPHPDESKEEDDLKPIGLGRSVSFNDFKPLKVNLNGFKISKLEENSKGKSRRRLDRSTHTWHLDSVENGRSNHPSGKSVSQLFFHYLERLVDQRVALAPRTSPELQHSSGEASPFGSPCRWYLGRENEDGKKNRFQISEQGGLQFQKRNVIHQVGNLSGGIGAQLKNSNRFEDSTGSIREKTQKTSAPIDISKGISALSLRPYSSTFSPVAESPLGKSSPEDSDCSRAELESPAEERKCMIRSRAGDNQFTPGNKLSIFAPPLAKTSLKTGNVKILPTSAMSIPRHNGFASNLPHTKQSSLLLSRSAPKYAVWQPSWKIRRQQRLREAGLAPVSTEPLPMLKPIEDSAKPSVTPRRVVGGFTASKPAESVFTLEKDFSPTEGFALEF